MAGPLPRAAIARSWGFVLVLASILFGAAGRIDLPAFWAYLGIYVATVAAGLAILDADLLRERMHPGGNRPPHRLMAAVGLAFVHLAVAGIDRGRLHWSDTVPFWLAIAGLILFALANAFSLWAMKVNRYFSSIARIQRERGQIVVDTGPYRWVRHPGYAAGMLLAVSSGLALGSWLATAIALLGVPFLLWRTIGEDRMLREQLDGYADYAARVRWRLLPGIW
jgi:protein-S-isoprenylcysteine O-methyltransferase Ste14